MATAVEAARVWGLELGEPFALSNFSYVAPAGPGVLKVAWEGDEESLHEADALEFWDGDGAVRLLRRSGRALLEERAVPGDDLSALPDDDATAIALDVASRLWRRAGSPFRAVAPEVLRWLEEAEREGSELVPLAPSAAAALAGVSPCSISRTMRKRDSSEYRILRGSRLPLYIRVSLAPGASDTPRLTGGPDSVSRLAGA